MNSICCYAKRNSATIALLAAYSLSVLVSALFGFWELTIHYTAGFLTPQMAVALLFALVSLFLAIKIALSNRASYPTLFLVAGIPLLFGFAIFFLPTCVPDEPTHINRLFDNRSGVEYTYVPTPILERVEESWVTSYKNMGELLSQTFDYSDVSPTDTNASSYSVINYIVPSTIVYIGRALGLNAWLLIYFARFANALMFLACGAWALSRTPICRPFLFVFLLNPMMIQQEASCSADALCNIAIIGFIVQTIAMFHSKNKNCTVVEWLTLLFFLALLALCKYAYLPIAIIGVLLLKRIGRSWIRTMLLIAFPACIVLGIIYVSAMGYMPSVINAAALLSNPVDFFELLIATLVRATPLLLKMYAGGQLGWPELGEVKGLFYIPFAWVGTLILMLLGLLASGCGHFARSEIINKVERFTLLFVSILTALVVFIGLAGSIRSVSETLRGYIDYMQGRYFFATGLLAAYGLMPQYAPDSAVSDALSRIKPLHFFIGSSAIGLYTLLFVIVLFD